MKQTEQIGQIEFFQLQIEIMYQIITMISKQQKL